MDTKSRAEKIAELAEHVLFSDIPDDSFTSQGVEGRRLLRQTIAAKLDEAVKEAFANGRLDVQYDNDTLPEQIEAYKNLAYSEGYAAAREQAAGICESLHLSTLAKVMRAMTPGGK